MRVYKGISSKKRNPLNGRSIQSILKEEEQEQGEEEKKVVVAPEVYDTVAPALDFEDRWMEEQMGDGKEWLLQPRSQDYFHGDWGQDVKAAFG